MSLIQGGNAGSRSNSMASTGNAHQQQHQNGKTFKQNANQNMITTMITPKKPRNG